MVFQGLEPFLFELIMFLGPHIFAPQNLTTTQQITYVHTYIHVAGRKGKQASHIHTYIHPCCRTKRKTSLGNPPGASHYSSNHKHVYIHTHMHVAGRKGQQSIRGFTLLLELHTYIHKYIHPCCRTNRTASLGNPSGASHFSSNHIHTYIHTHIHVAGRKGQQASATHQGLHTCAGPLLFWKHVCARQQNNHNSTSSR